MKIEKLFTNKPDALISILEECESPAMVFVRGLPGHNRNTFAREVALAIEGAQCIGFDDLFTVDPSATKRLYKFRPERVSESHEIVRDKAEFCVLNQVDTIIIANPFLNRRNLMQYFIPLAQSAGYQVIVVTLSDETNPHVLVARDEHGKNGAPLYVVSRMVAEWEQDPDLSETL